MTHIAQSQASGCPFAKTALASKQTIQFEDPPQKNWITSSFVNTKEFLSRFGFESFRNAWLTYSLADLDAVFSKTYKSNEIISDFKTLTGTQYLIKNHDVLQLVLNHFRNEENGLFHVPENKKIFIDEIVNDLYPEEMSNVSDIEKEVLNAMIFTAESSHIPALRGRLMNFLKQKSVQAYRGKLDNIASEILDQLSASEKSSCLPAYLVYEFAVTVICKLFIGHFVSREEYQEIVRSLVIINDHISDLILHRPQDKQKKERYRVALQSIKQLIDQHLINEDSSPLIKGLMESDFNEFAIKLYLFFFYIASTETTSAATHYLLLELGKKKHEHFQKTIREEGKDSIFLKKCIAESLRLNPPIYIMGRTLREDKLITIRDENNHLVWSKLLLKDHHLICWISGAGRDVKTFPNPEEFNPLRFDSVPTSYPWLPFTIGPHSCPGQFLAKAEMESLITEMLSRFHISNDPYEAEIKTKGAFTLHADPDGEIRMKLTPFK